MRIKSLLNWFLFVSLTVPLGILSCQDCNDCGPSEAQPIVNFQFFNMDSLIKVEDTLTVLEDSLDQVLAGIDTGNTDLDTIRTWLEAGIDLYEGVQEDIESGKIKIDEVSGPNGEGPIYFQDSLTNDSLTIFPFPIDMNHDSCSYIIRIDGISNRIGLKYVSELEDVSQRILVRIYEVSVTQYTYDSVKIICNKNNCYSNETKIYIYF